MTDISALASLQRRVLAAFNEKRIADGEALTVALKLEHQVKVHSEKLKIIDSGRNSTGQNGLPKAISAAQEAGIGAGQRFEKETEKARQSVVKLHADVVAAGGIDAALTQVAPFRAFRVANSHSPRCRDAADLFVHSITRRKS